MTLLQAANRALDNWMESSKSSRLLKIDITAVIGAHKNKYVGRQQTLFSLYPLGKGPAYSEPIR